MPDGSTTPRTSVSQDEPGSLSRLPVAEDPRDGRPALLHFSPLRDVRSHVVHTKAARHQRLGRIVNPMSASRDFADHLARLTYLCSEIGTAVKGEQIPTDRLRDVLQEAEDLCRAVRQEIARRGK